MSGIHLKKELTTLYSYCCQSSTTGFRGSVILKLKPYKYICTILFAVFLHKFHTYTNKNCTVLLTNDFLIKNPDIIWLTMGSGATSCWIALYLFDLCNQYKFICPKIHYDHSNDIRLFTFLAENGVVCRVKHVKVSCIPY